MRLTTLLSGAVLLVLFIPPVTAGLSIRTSRELVQFKCMAPDMASSLKHSHSPCSYHVRLGGSPPHGDINGDMPEDSLSEQGGVSSIQAAAGAIQAGVGKVADFASNLAGRAADMVFPGKKKDSVEL